MSNLNDLYKESGITPFRPGQEQKSPVPSRKKNGNHYIISLVLAFVIFAGVMLVLDSNGKHPLMSMRGSAIYIVPLTYVINLVIRLFKKLISNINS